MQITTNKQILFASVQNGLLTFLDFQQEEVLAVYKAALSTNTKKLQNSPCRAYKYSLIIFRREVNDENQAFTQISGYFFRYLKVAAIFRKFWDIL